MARSSARIWVPSGTLITTSGAPAPVRAAPEPLPPFLARKCCEERKSISVVRCSPAWTTTAAPAVAAVRAAERDVFLAAERHHAVAAVAGTQVDLGLVEKLHRVIPK